MIKIDKDVPAPSEGKYRYPFANMKVGDSFTVDYKKRESAITAAAQFAKQQQPSWKFQSRKEGDQARIWRIV